MEDELERIVKDRTTISCDNEKCPLYGETWRCYKGNERDCGIYEDWEKGYKKHGNLDK